MTTEVGRGEDVGGVGTGLLGWIFEERSLIQVTRNHGQNSKKYSGWLNVGGSGRTTTCVYRTITATSALFVAGKYFFSLLSGEWKRLGCSRSKAERW